MDKQQIMEVAQALHDNEKLYHAHKRFGDLKMYLSVGKWESIKQIKKASLESGSLGFSPQSKVYPTIYRGRFFVHKTSTQYYGSWWTEFQIAYVNDDGGILNFYHQKAFIENLKDAKAIVKQIVKLIEEETTK